MPELTRRRFLALGMVGGTAALFVGGWRWGGPHATDMLDRLADAFFSTDEPSGFPRPSELDAGMHAWALAQRLPPAARWQLHGLLRLVEWGAVPLAGARFSRLQISEQTALLTRWAQAAPITPRLAVLALKQLCAMGTFRHPSMWSAIGYAGPTVLRGAHHAGPP